MSISNEVGEWMVVTRTDGVSTGVCGEMQMGSISMKMPLKAQLWWSFSPEYSSTLYAESVNKLFLFLCSRVCEFCVQVPVSVCAL